MVAVSSETGECFMCTCDLASFPSDYVEVFRYFKELSAYAVQVTIPLIFASPISPDDVGTLLITSNGTAKSKSTPIFPARVQHAGRARLLLDVLDAWKGICFVCGAKSAKEGAKL
jgi:hypothetical protein